MSTIDPVSISDVHEATSDELLAPGPIEVAFQWAVDALEDFCRKDLLDEETLTASFLGGLRVAIPAAAKGFGSGIAERTRRCSWAAFNKAGRVTSENSEAANGADFALVLWESETHAHLCIFQAKRAGVKGPKNTFNIHSAPSQPSDRSPQLVMLAATGLRFVKALEMTKGCSVAAERTSPPPPDRSALVKWLNDADAKSRMRVFGALDWIRYLVYHNGHPICIPLSELPPDSVAQEFEVLASGANNVDIGFAPDTLRDLIQSGLGATEPEEGWLRVDKETLEALLPDLLDLMQVYDASGRGGGLVNRADARVEVVAQPSSPAQTASLQAEIATGATPSERPGARP